MIHTKKTERMIEKAAAWAANKIVFEGKGPDWLEQFLLAEVKAALKAEGLAVAANLAAKGGKVWSY